MSRWFRRAGGERITRDLGAHARAHELAARRMDEPLAPADEAWLTQHLAACDGCRSVAGEYEAQRLALRGLRGAQPEPPRDLWARTAAAIDAAGAPPARAARRRSLPLAPAAGLLVIALAVFGVLNGRSPLLPGSANVAVATPIAIPGGVLQVISRGQDGSVELLSRQLDQVCPMGTTSCGLSESMDVTQSTRLEGDARLAAIISPTEDHLVVVERGSGPQRLYVLPVSHAEVTSPSPETSPETPSPSEPPSDSASPTSGGTSEAPGTPEPTTGAPDTPQPTEEPSPTASPAPTAPSTEPPSASPSDAQSPTPAPSVVVSPGPDGALEIASDVTVIGSAAGYSGDGTAFAFSARPADGSAGPDVFVWQGSDARAVAVTNDHASVFDGWLGNRLLISRIVDGEPVTAIVNRETGEDEQVGSASMWRPSVSPDGQVAAWWDGTLKAGDDGQTWVPDEGRLVLAPWPDGGSEVQVLAAGPLGDWEVQWDPDSSAVAVWISDGGSYAVGSLSLYPVDRKTGLADLEHPALEDAPAYDSISLRPGHLAWLAPDSAGDTKVNVLAWQGNTFGRLQLSTIPGAGIVR